ncbi:hypothetical protein [Viridibacillus sp. FSL H7-0596]|nr:hypothetical protein [Viridibacillus sp. FSL H7-0596]
MQQTADLVQQTIELTQQTVKLVQQTISSSIYIASIGCKIN